MATAADAKVDGGGTRNPHTGTDVAGSGAGNGVDVIFIGEGSNGPSGPASTFETAMRVEVDGTPILTDELAADQVDHFVFTAKAGTFYEIVTLDETYSPDTVITLFDPRRNALAMNDEGGVWPDDKFDARLVVRTQESGDYYLRVEDLVTRPSFFSGGDRLLSYHLSVREISSETKGYALWSDSAPPLAFESEQRSGYRFVTVIGEFQQDDLTVRFSGMPELALIARVHPGGPKGSGSTVVGGRLTVRGSDGAELATIDRAKQQQNLAPPLGDGEHTLTLTGQQERGESPFFAVDMVLVPDNPDEQSEAENGTPEGAELLPLSRGATGRGLFLAQLAPGDVDYFRVEAQKNHHLYARCEAEASGSGVRGLKVELRDAADQVLVSMPERASGAEATTMVEEAGTYYVRLSSDASSGSPSVQPWARCVVVLG